MKYSEEDLIRLWLDNVKKNNVSNSDVDLTNFLKKLGYEVPKIRTAIVHAENISKINVEKDKLSSAQATLNTEIQKIVPYYTKLSKKDKKNLSDVLKLEVGQ